MEAEVSSMRSIILGVSTIGRARIFSPMMVSTDITVAIILCPGGIQYAICAGMDSQMLGALSQRSGLKTQIFKFNI